MYAKVKMLQAEQARKMLLSEGVLDHALAVERSGGYVLFPVRSLPKEGVWEIVSHEGRRKERRPRSLKEALEGVLETEELVMLPSSFTVVGDIVVLELDDRLMPKKAAIGAALIRSFKNIKVVAVKTGQVSGEYRVPGVEVIAGEGRTVTRHREHGCVYKVDVAKAYFNPRLGTERLRVAGLAKKGERVLVMFAGVGPYAILTAKISGADVTAVELNPVAAELMRWNALLNRTDVKVVEGDARSVVPNLGSFDRIIMPLPKLADTFLDVALPALNRGGVIHYYMFARNTLEATGHLAETVGSLGLKASILDTALCGSYNPAMKRICVDFKVE